MTKYELTKELLEKNVKEANVVYTTTKNFNVSTMSVFGDEDETETEIVKADGDIIIAISGNYKNFINVMYYVDGNPVGIFAEIDDIYGYNYIEDNRRLIVPIVTYDDTYCDIIFENATEITEDQTL